MIRGDGWARYSIWEHSAHIRELYGRRCRLEEEEMTCAAQAAELLAPLVSPGDTLLDVGCGSGYFYHSLKKRSIPAEYYGLDAAAPLIEIGQRFLPEHGLSAERLRVLRIEDLHGEADHVLCLNVLSNLDNYHRPLERLLHCARKSVILRESLKDLGEYSYVRDRHLDEGVDLKVHVNAYPIHEVTEFMTLQGFEVQHVEDRRTRGGPEMVIGHPHHWAFLIARRVSGKETA